MGCEAGQCKTSTPQGIFIVTPSLEGWPTKAKEAPSPHEVRLTPLFFTENNLISPNLISQSGFRPGDSCVNQLLAITHKIYKSFDEGFEVRGVFLDISKAFDKIWHES